MTLYERVAELLGHPGDRKEIERTMVADGLALSDSSVPDGSPLTLSAVLDSLGDGIVVSGTVRYPWAGECRRCLSTVTGNRQAEVREIYSRLGDEDTFPLDGDEIDLEPLIREAVLLDLPLAPLCSDDCRGPAPEEYPAEPPREPDPDADAVGEASAARDPRWAPLDELDFE